MNILLIGGTGFIGSAIGRALQAQGHRLRFVTRRRDRCKHLLTLPQAEVIEADIFSDATLQQLMQGQDAIISMVGILRGNFQRVHAELPARIATAAKAVGVRRIIHISALGADTEAPSDYLRSKAAGEAALHNSGLDVTILRPSVVFGQGDSFLTLFAQLLAIAPVLPLACPHARFQPVWVEDVAATVVTALQRSESIGQTYSLGGPRAYSLRGLVQLTGRVAGHPRWVIGLPRPLSWLQAAIMGMIPGAPMSLDNYRSMQVDNVCAHKPSLPFGREAAALETIAPSYLRLSRRQQGNSDFREQARR